MPTPFLPGTAGRESEVALCSDTEQRTWLELESSIRRIANGFACLGLGEGDRVAVLAANCVQWVEIMLASVRGGTKVVPVNWHLTAPEVAYMLADSGTRVLVCDAHNAQVGRAAAREAGVEHMLVIGEGFSRWSEGQSDAEPVNVRAGGPMFYTSGTTGRPKGVVNRARESTVDGIWPLLRASAHHSHGYQDRGVHLLVCPAYHAAPYMHVLLSMATAHRVVVMSRFDAQELLRTVDESRVTTTHLVPTQMMRLLALPDAVKSRYDVSSIQQLIHGAAPCPPWVKQAMIDWFGPVISEYYGFSEGAGMTYATSADWLARPGTVGQAPEGIEIQVVADQGGELAAGEVGTIYFRRPGKPSPYYHNAPDKTAESERPGGWFSVGDVGWLDADGYLFLADRKSDMIISGGVNIYPAEVEAALSEHPAVEDCAVFGVPDEEWGEAVKAAVMMAPGVEAVDEATLIAWCHERIAGFKCPRSIDFHDALPREASGKLMKRKLREPYWQDRGRRI